MSEGNYQEFLSRLPTDRRTEIEKVWQVIRDNMPSGYSEDIDAKFLTFKVGKEWYVALANQKNYISLHLLPIYHFTEMRNLLDKSDKKIKCGKGCVNFKKAEELPLEIIGEIISATDAETYQAKIRNAKSKR
jgi:hypothetical protein